MSSNSSDAAAETVATEADWREAVDRVLKGRSFDRVLKSSTRAGLGIEPLYQPAGGGEAVLASDAHRLTHGWDIRQQHLTDDLDAARAAILDDLENGVTSIELARRSGSWSTEDLRKVLDGVLLDIAPIALAPHCDLSSARALLDIIGERGDQATSRSWLGLDPLGATARGDSTGHLDAVAELAANSMGSHPNVLAVTVDTTRYVDAGANEVQELAWMLASGVAALRALESAGMPVDQAAGTIGFRVSVDADQFLSIARLRAARVLWQSVLAASGAPDASSPIHAVTSPAMFSRRDVEVNMLRITSATFGAGIGGADAITALTYDGSDSALARRNARNVHHLLIDESGINRLVDPSAGSAFVESLTARLIDEAWAEFQSVEASGGMEAQLADGSIRSAVDRSWQTRLDSLATRREPVTGVSEFPEDGPGSSAADTSTGFPMRRPAAPFETLRDTADQARSGGNPPVVQLAALGALADHTARSTWISNLLAVGGIEAHGGDSDGATDAADAATRFRANGGSVAVICSSDSVYEHHATTTAAALKAAGAEYVALAGNPGEHRDALADAGVDAFWHVGIDVLETLTDLHRRLGLAEKNA